MDYSVGEEDDDWEPFPSAAAFQPMQDEAPTPTGGWGSHQTSQQLTGTGTSGALSRNAAMEHNTTGRRGVKRSAQSHGTSSPNMAGLYADQLEDNNAFRREMLVVTNRWRSEELKDRKAAREAVSK